jgi:hypothetical protein
MPVALLKGDWRVFFEVRRSQAAVFGPLLHGVERPQKFESPAVNDIVAITESSRRKVNSCS